MTTRPEEEEEGFIAKNNQLMSAQESFFLNQLPKSEFYEKSYMHKEAVSHVLVTSSEYIVTASTDGYLKFWKKMETGIEFVKTYRAHSCSLNSMAGSFDGQYIATTASDQTIKIFDVINFDMINIIKIDFISGALCWIYQKQLSQALFAVSDQSSAAVYIFDARASQESPGLQAKVHSHPVFILDYNVTFDFVISIDVFGHIEYWTPRENYSIPSQVGFQFKSDTDLYALVKSKAVPLSFSFSKSFEFFVVYSSDRQIRVFKTLSGRLYRQFDESLACLCKSYSSGLGSGDEETSLKSLDDIEFGRRLAIEKDLDKIISSSISCQGDKVPLFGVCLPNVIFDASENFLLYPSLRGIKVKSLASSKTVLLIGKSESFQRFTKICLFQGVPKKKGVVTFEMEASDNPVFREMPQIDPSLFCIAYKKNRFYLFTKREPEMDESKITSDRDVLNEKPSKEELNIINSKVALGALSKSKLPTQAIIHTSMGDISIKLFPELAPKAVENFVKLSCNNAYNRNIFHRVIKGFMIQTGDPTGEGTGGQSIWGKEFNDEIVPSLQHDRPYTVSMANAGANTNGSQFFITTVPCPWLDGKNTIFGRCIAGMDTTHKIEKIKVNKDHRPLNDVYINSIDIIQ